MIKDKINYLAEFALDERVAQLKRVLAMRTRHITVCLENIYQSQNASAVLRTCDALGIQDIHIIELNNAFQVDKAVALGTNKWLDVYKYNSSQQSPTLEAIDVLRRKGYRIVATTPHDNSVSLNDFDLGKGKVALFFGTELTGLSDEVMHHADEFLHIPMCGFVESFNVSVSASIILYQLSQKLRNSSIPWQLSEEEHDVILFDWLESSIRASDLILKRFPVNE